MKKMYIQEDNSADVIHSLSISDSKLFFGPLCKDHRFLIYDGNNISEILVKLELAPSLSFCRKNGWWRQLKHGYQEFVYGKNKVRICILTT